MMILCAILNAAFALHWINDGNAVMTAVNSIPLGMVISGIWMDIIDETHWL